MNKNKINERIGKENINKQGYLMRIIEYNNANDIIVEFQDEYKTKVHTQYCNFLTGNTANNNYFSNQRLSEEGYNYQGCLMKIIEYNTYNDIVIEFQDDYKTRIKTRYSLFLSGSIKNPYYPSVYGIGVVGNKYPISDNGKETKECKLWKSMLQRSFDKKLKNKHPTYKDVTCCKEWLLFENFYEWLYNQENFDKWLNKERYKERWCLDKDIIEKGNKIYSPETCCLVPVSINNLFIKSNAVRGILPIGVTKYGNRFRALCNNPLTNKPVIIGYYDTPEEAFQAYKKYKENTIKQIATIEYDKGNITKRCYEAMMNYEVEITD